jgi:nucleoside recognition membrane protein YjiH
MADFAEWESFYVIIAGAAGALIGLQFVVMTLIADRPQLASPEAGAAFATPTIVHFCSALLLSAVLRAPWHAVWPAAALWGVVGIAGLAYTTVIVRRMRRQTTYQPDVEDWLFYAALPTVGYAVLAAAALAAPSHERSALFAVGAATLVLLFIGIRNSWDTISYHVLVNLRRARESR